MVTPTEYRSAVERRSLTMETAHHYFIPASYRAYRVLHFGFVVAPIVAGLDKFTNLLVNWTVYLSPRATALTGVTAPDFMRGVGVIEVIAGLIVAFKPRVGGWIVAAWLWGIIANLLSIPGYYDIALRDFGLSLGAIALAQLSVEFGQYRRQFYTRVAG